MERVDCKSMGFVAADWCTVKQLRHDETVRNLTYGDLEIPLAVIRLGVTGLKKTELVYLLDMFGGSGKKGWYPLVKWCPFLLCVKRL